MAVGIPITSASAESIFDFGNRLAGLLEQAKQEATGGRVPENIMAGLTDTVEVLRSRVVRKAECDPRSLFDLDERLVALMDRAEEAATDGEIPQELLQEITDYLEAFRTKVDRIAGYWRWQESIAEICGKEADRLTARKKAAEGRLERLKGMLLSFMLCRGVKRLEGEKAAIGLQANGMASLVIDDPSQLGECFLENSIWLTKAELRELVRQMADGELRRRMEATLAGKGWEVNSFAVRAAMTSVSLPGARLVKGHHVRLR